MKKGTFVRNAKKLGVTMENIQNLLQIFPKQGILDRQMYYLRKEGFL